MARMSRNTPRDPGAGLRSSLEIDEENLGEPFQDQDLDHLLSEGAPGDSPEISPTHPRRATAKSPARWEGGAAQSRALNIDDDDDVPASLLLEEGRPAKEEEVDARSRHIPLPVPGPAAPSRPRWNRNARRVPSVQRVE